MLDARQRKMQKKLKKTLKWLVVALVLLYGYQNKEAILAYMNSGLEQESISEVETPLDVTEQTQESQDIHTPSTPSNATETPNTGEAWDVYVEMPKMDIDADVIFYQLPGELLEQPTEDEVNSENQQIEQIGEQQ